MGSDNRGKKSLDWRAAKLALHCNNCITLVLGIVLLISGMINFKTGTIASIKYRLCNDTMFDNMLQSNIVVRNRIKKYCHPDEKDHCSKHTDCKAGYYCDEDYNCWDCDYVLSDENECDGFDGKCDKCLRADVAPTLAGTDSTKLVKEAAPDSAVYLWSAATIAIVFGLIIIVSSLFGFLGDALRRRTLLFAHHFVVLILAISMLYATIYCMVVCWHGTILSSRLHVLF